MTDEKKEKMWKKREKLKTHLYLISAEFIYFAQRNHNKTLQFKLYSSEDRKRGI